MTKIATTEATEDAEVKSSMQTGLFLRVLRVLSGGEFGCDL